MRAKREQQLAELAEEEVDAGREIQLSAPASEVEAPNVLPKGKDCVS
jgi:hypothetical protein